jgi:hypothetical protein
MLEGVEMESVSGLKERDLVKDSAVTMSGEAMKA